MGTTKRERQKAGRQTRLAEAEREHRREQRRRRIITFGGGAVVIVGALALWSVVSGDDDTTDEAATTTTALDGEADPPALVAPPAGESVTGETPCPAVDGSEVRTTSFESPPPLCIDPALAYTAEVMTSKGSFTIELDADAAPETVNNFVVLARYHYFDGAPFHRIIPDFVVQGGDAVGDPLGTGNPGYEIADELPDAPADGSVAYPVNSVAMANSGPDTNGSQFFVVTGAQGEALALDFSRFGEVTSGMDIVLEIEAVGTPGTGAPTEAVTIDAVTITEA